MSINSNVKKELQKNLTSMLKFRENRRSQEEIINDATFILRNIKKDTFLPFLLQMINAIHFRDSLEVFKILKSPLKQFAYLVDLYFSKDHSEKEDSPDEKEWDKLMKLLDEVEMTYFGEIGFFEENTTNFQLDKISVSLKSFFEYYANGQLSFDEQTIYRIQSNFFKFDNDIFREYGFKTDDIIKFCLSINQILQEKADKSLYYHQHPEKWKELTSKFIERGVIDPKDWAIQPELKDLFGFMTRPGYIFIVKKKELSLINLEDEIISNLIEFLKYDVSKVKGRTIYYADNRQYFDTPLIELSNDEILFPNGKFLLEAFYNRISLKLSEVRKEKYIQFKNKMLENKCLKIFKHLFKEDAKFFSSFYFDKTNKAEQDLAIFYKGTFLIIEIKDFKFRAPMRNPIKAFDKIRSDFKNGIQKAYDQCKRLENKIEEKNNFKIYDVKTNKELFEVRPQKIKNFYSIVVTQHKYGGIQTNLEELLIKNEEDLYPYSICVDDLEIFLLTLQKLKNGSARESFLNYIDYREAFHERLICSDELEMCGLFLTSPSLFKKLAHKEDILTTNIKMSDIFDAHYLNGLGFENEINFHEKRKSKLREYAKNFNVDFISADDIY
ncbi:NERD domain-containing protein [Chryseobacterium arthrosphaerae]|uniref:NERD domain-containing protein n=1 Tax=Chryseobacterium arthrosphaerae TaxID=651561 RepID=UPI001BAEE7DC|nr:NERD domain-containing protein [Chryseobacterium arthrosphaerae]QUY56570.1 NERD domain-containing protein [Chryseobacterium arthrosphaerae]